MSVLMRDVAARAGVSITTVSHVLNETRSVAETTRARVLEAIAELNYFKNTSARLLVRGRSDLLGLVISDIENPFFPELIKSFESACGRERLEVLLSATNYDRRQAEAVLRRMLENRVQGVAVMTSQFDEGLADRLSEKDIPLVTLGSVRAKKNRSSIKINYRKGVSQAVRRLYEKGHRAMAIASGPLDQLSAIEYQTAIVDSLKEAGLSPFAVIEGDHGPESGARAVRALLSGGRRPTAIFCGNDRMAIGALGVAGEMGFQVPRDVSIVGSDDIWMARYCYPALTTVRIPRDALGQLAFEVLIKMVRSKRKPSSRHVLETQFVERQSTGFAARKMTVIKRTSA